MQPIAIFQDRQVVLAVTGSIAAYKAADLASQLTQAGALVDVILTESATRFVRPLTFQSLTGRPVHTTLWEGDGPIRHVALGDSADLLVIAPATANTIAKLAHGLADDLLTVTALAARCPVMIAPAMDGGMYEHPATQENIEQLRRRGVVFAGPAIGRMASGLSGLGRMLEPDELLAHVRQLLAAGGPMSGRKVVVTAGPTREAIDPVRFISNRSTGKQGLAIAQAALDAGAEVIVVAGPISESIPWGATAVHVETTEEMAKATLAQVNDADALFMVAAVADFRPDSRSDRKIKKTEVDAWGLAIGLEPTLDILTAVKQQREETGYPRVVLGFAAETHDAYEYGRDKLLRKGLQFIAVNDVSAADAGFAVDTNRVVLLGPAGVVEEMPLMSKSAVADRLIYHVSRLLAEVAP
jgi:phosphopantothenoylcysteine decarboxylase/phosphopantothenate--cysteine ligase